MLPTLPMLPRLLLLLLLRPPPLLPPPLLLVLRACAADRRACRGAVRACVRVMIDLFCVCMSGAFAAPSGEDAERGPGAKQPSWAPRGAAR
jgi:hypothetical protein